MALTFLYLLDWALIALSFFNTIAMIWLGLTVLLNAERRGWGTWLAGCGLLSGALFFVIHTSIIGRALVTLDGELAVWWRFIWLPFIASPYLWYLVMAWYSGVLHTWAHRAAVLAVSLLGAIAAATLFVANPLPSYDDVVARTPAQVFTLAGVPVAVLVYPAYSVLCILLALAALRRPAASDRFMGELGRNRARPWLLAASLALLLVSLAAGTAFAWLLGRVQLGSVPGATLRSLGALMVLDLLISALIAIVVVLLGKAIVSYELFTGKALPRGGLTRYWRNSLVLASGYGLLVGGSLAVPIAPIYQVLLATLLVAVFYALLSWRAFVEREQAMERLRPFVASEHLYERLVGPPAPPDTDPTRTFVALCDDVLNTRVGYLAAFGPLAQLAGPPLVFPLPWPALGQDGRRKTEDGGSNDYQATSRPGDQEIGDQRQETRDRRPEIGGQADLGSRVSGLGSTVYRLPSLDMLQSIIAHLKGPQLCLPLDPAQYAGAVWAVPLWNARGPTGVLLLGDKRDGGLYTQEELEIARAAAERLLDAQAGAELSRRLMALQRRRFAESQVLDRRARRVLHDDVLPQIHAVLLQISDFSFQIAMPDEHLAVTTSVHPASANNLQSTIYNLQSQLTAIHRQIAGLLRELPPTAEPELARLGLVGALRQVVAGELGQAFDAVTWQVEPLAEQRARLLPALRAEVLFFAAREALRNAARYGRGSNPARLLHLTVAVGCQGSTPTTQTIELQIEDDGVGVTIAAPVLSDTAGAGQGLALHSTMMAVIGGTLTLENRPSGGARVTLALPVATNDQ